MANRFFTVLIIPEKTSQVRRILIPAWVLRGALVGVFFVAVLGTIMLLDYWYVMNQITENKQLKIENRRLKQQVQVFNNKITTIESTMERIKTFSTRLKVITNIEDHGNLIQSLNQKLPDANLNIGNTGSLPKAPQSEPTPGDPAQAETAPVATTSLVAASAASAAGAGTTDLDPEDLQLRKEYTQLDTRFSDLNSEVLLVEQTLQDQYELLADQKAFLAALPTRKPATGYFTSGFGVRKSPYGGREKMHEGLDIANRPGTMIRSPADGVVIFAGTKSGYGQTVIVDHGYGLETWYAHTRKIVVTKGKKVRRGDSLALLGSTGRSTGPHLHYEVRVNGTPVDPLSYILEN